MKIIVPILLLALVAGNLRGASEHVVESRVSAVTVYLQKAVITRTATLDLEAGEHRVIFKNLPSAMVEESVQVSGAGTAPVVVLDVNTSTQFLPETPHERLKEVEAQIRDFRHELRDLTDAASVLQAQREYLDRIAKATTSVPRHAGQRPGVARCGRKDGCPAGRSSLLAAGSSVDPLIDSDWAIGAHLLEDGGGLG